jgi:protein-tyrosine-phosphatase
MLRVNLRSEKEPSLRVLFLCTQNSARSQIAEALLNARRDPRVTAASAGTRPAAQVNPFAAEVLRELDIEHRGARPKSIDEVLDDPWDIVITVCDSARESCPVFPGRPITAHWGVPDPAEAEGDEEAKRRAFRDAAMTLGRRIDLLLALPMEKLEGLALEGRVRGIGESA